MKKIILVSIAMLAGFSASAAVEMPASSSKECSDLALAYSKKVTGDKGLTQSITVKKADLVTGSLAEIIYFNDANFNACKAQIKKGDYSCNSVTLDVLFSSDSKKCTFIGFELGDGNG